MSAIDTIEHAHVANFFGIPVYWPLKNYPSSHLVDDSDGIIGKHTLIIGGGSGEHPALILDMEKVVMEFIFDELYDDYDSDTLSQDDKELLQQLDKVVALRKLLGHDRKRILDLNQWPIETFLDISKSLTDQPYRTIESIINTCAIFIICEMPIEECISNPDLLRLLFTIRDGKWEKLLQRDLMKSFKGFSGVLNMSKCGQIMKRGMYRFGYSLNDWLNDNR